MKEEEARQVLAEIDKLCKERGLWLRVIEDNKPELDMLKIEISIKVEQ